MTVYYDYFSDRLRNARARAAAAADEAERGLHLELARLYEGLMNAMPADRTMIDPSCRAGDLRKAG